MQCFHPLKTVIGTVSGRQIVLLRLLSIISTHPFKDPWIVIGLHLFQDWQMG